MVITTENNNGPMRLWNTLNGKRDDNFECFQINRMKMVQCFGVMMFHTHKHAHINMGMHISYSYKHNLNE